jgi:hypothetical protein
VPLLYQQRVQLATNGKGGPQNILQKETQKINREKKRENRNKREAATPKMEGRVQPGSTNAEIEPEHILLGPKIGDGSFGTVYKVPPNPNPQSQRAKRG